MKLNKVMMILGLTAGLAGSAHAGFMRPETELDEINTAFYKKCTYDESSGTASCVTKDGVTVPFPRAFKKCPGDRKKGNFKLGKLPAKQWGKGESCVIYDEVNPWE